MNAESPAPLPAEPVAEVPAEEAGPPAPSRLQRLISDLRQAGSYGQTQWQRWIDGLRRARPEVEDEGPEAAAPEAPAAPLAKRLLDSPAVLRAQRRGASLLLSLAAAVRTQAEQLERGLESLRQDPEAEAAAS